MELVEKACLLCFENSTVISEDASKIYFNLLNKDNYCNNNLNDNKFNKLFESKCVCISCAYKIDKVYNLIQHIVNNNDNYFKKSHSKRNKCAWCHDIKENLLMYVNYTDELKDIVVDFVKSVTKKEFDLTHWSSCLNCNFCLISWNYIKNSINSLLDGNLKRSSKSVDKEQVRSKMPKIKIKLTQNKPKPKTKTKSKGMKRKINVDNIETKLKHLESVSQQAEEFNVDLECSNDQKMWFDIPIVYIEFEDIEAKCKRIKDGNESSESEVEYVEASTSSAPTKPPVRRKKSWNNQHFSENDISNEEATPKKKNKRVSFADSIEIKNLTPESGEDAKKKSSKKSTSKRNLRVRKSDSSEEDTPKKKTRNKSSVENDIEKISYKCSICEDEFPARCDKKLHEFGHNMNFSPVILLDTTAVDNMHNSKKMNGYIDANDADDESTIKSGKPRIKRRNTNRNKIPAESLENDKTKENASMDDLIKIDDEENKMEDIVKIDEIINKIDDSDQVEEDSDKQNSKSGKQNGVKKKNNKETDEDELSGDEDKNKSEEIISVSDNETCESNKLQQKEDKIEVDEDKTDEKNSKKRISSSSEKYENENSQEDKTNVNLQTEKISSSTESEESHLSKTKEDTNKKESILNENNCDSNTKDEDIENNESNKENCEDVSILEDETSKEVEKPISSEDSIVEKLETNKMNHSEDSDKENKKLDENNENEDKNCVSSLEASTNDTDSVKSLCGSDEDSASKNVDELNENDEAININEDLDDTLKNDKSLLEDISDGEMDEVLSSDMVSLNDGTIHNKIDDVILNIDDVKPEPTDLTQPTDSDLDNVGDIITDGDNDSDSIHLSLSSDFFNSNSPNDDSPNTNSDSDRFKEVESLLEGLGA